MRVRQRPYLCPVCGRRRLATPSTPSEYRRQLGIRQCRPCAYEAKRLSPPGRYDVDEIVVDAVLTGAQMQTTVGERALIIDELTRRGWSTTKIARHLGVVERTVTRYRTRLWRVDRLAA